MKNLFYTIVFALVASLSISACTEETIQPVDGGGNSSDPCQFGGPNCPK